jgi:cytochrome c-type biogenesis protein
MPEVTYIAAVLAGLLSFLSPCVLPLVPPYLAYVAGTTVERLSSDDSDGKGRALFAALFFVLGFSTVFVLLGAGASSAGQLLRQYADTLAIIAGGAIILMGLHFLGLFRIAALYGEKRFQVARANGPGGAYVMGLAFAFGWTPCIGPVLAGVLAVAGSEASVTRGMALLAAYSLGLGIPFLACALFMGRLSGLMRRMKENMHLIEKATGAALVLTGIAFLTGGMATAAFWLLETFPVLAKLG